MIDCKQFQTLAGGLLEGETHRDAEAHLADCPHCRGLMDDLSAITRACHELPEHSPSDHLWTRLGAVAREESLWEHQSWWSEWFPVPARVAFASGLAGLVLLVAGGLVGESPWDSSLASLEPANSVDVARGELMHQPAYTTRYQVHLIQVERAILDESAPVTEHLIELTERPLNTVEEAIERARSRLVKYPDDELAQTELRRLYSQKASVLQAMANPVWLERGE